MVEKWSLSRQWEIIIDATDLTGAGRLFQIFWAVTLKAPPSVLVLVNGTINMSKAKKRSSRFEKFISYCVTHNICISFQSGKFETRAARRRVPYK